MLAEVQQDVHQRVGVSIHFEFFGKHKGYFATILDAAKIAIILRADFFASKKNFRRPPAAAEQDKKEVKR
jgi:hypothetical protein